MDDEYYMKVLMLACPGVLVNVATGLTGLSPVVMDFSSSKNWSFIMVPYLLVPLKYSICGGILVPDIHFC